MAMTKKDSIIDINKCQAIFTKRQMKAQKKIDYFLETVYNNKN